MAKHLPAVSWNTRLDWDKPYQTVRTLNTKEIGIGFMPGDKQNGFLVPLSRRDARLLARRINQCLDGTR